MKVLKEERNVWEEKRGMKYFISIFRKQDRNRGVTYYVLPTPIIYMMYV